MSEPAESPGKRALSVAIALVLVVFVAFAAITLFGPAIGWRVGAVVSGSMEPSMHAGDVMITRPVDPGEVEVGDVVLFKPTQGESFVAHRVIAITQEPDLRFVTKGDANNARDPNPVSTGELEGILFLNVPYLYLLFTLIRTPLGLLLTIGIPAAILISFELRKFWTRGDGR